jgi:hypothetical protein
MRLVAMEEGIGLSPGIRRHFAYAASSPPIVLVVVSFSIHETLGAFPASKEVENDDEDDWEASVPGRIARHRP